MQFGIGWSEKLKSSKQTLVKNELFVDRHVVVWFTNEESRSFVFYVFYIRLANKLRGLDFIGIRTVRTVDGRVRQMKGKTCQESGQQSWNSVSAD